MMIDLASVALWGFVATLVLTTIQSGGQGLRLTRMSLPLMLGTMVSGNLDRVKIYGFLIHFANGWAFSLVYALIFEALGRVSWLIGGIAGLVHGLFILAVLIPVMPSIHPRMASEYQHPDPTSLLEPPGFLALHYGRRTPLLMIAAHLVYGIILGALYTVGT